MNDNLLADYAVAAEQPVSTEIRLCDGLFIKTMHVKRSGTYIPQHAHKYDHISFVAAGSVRVWKDGRLMGDFTAPKPITIEAEALHTFMSLCDDVSVLCIHNIKDAEAVEITEEHQIVGGF